MLAKRPLPNPPVGCLSLEHPALACIPPVMGAHPLLSHWFDVWETQGCSWCLQSCPAPSLQPQDFRSSVGGTGVGFFPYKPNPRFGAKFLPWGGPRGPRQHLSHVCSHAHSPDLMPVPADFAAREGLTAPPRRPRSRKVSCPLMRSNGDLVGLGGGGRCWAGAGGQHGQHQGTAAGVFTGRPISFSSSLVPSAPPHWALRPPAPSQNGPASHPRQDMVRGPSLGLSFTLSYVGGLLSDTTEAVSAEGRFWSLRPVLTLSCLPFPPLHLQESPGAQALWSWALRMPCLWPLPSLSMSTPTFVATPPGTQWVGGGAVQSLTGKQSSLGDVLLGSSRDSFKVGFMTCCTAEQHQELS